MDGTTRKNAMMGWLLKNAEKPQHPGPDSFKVVARRETLEELFDVVPEPESWIADPEDGALLYALAGNKFMRLAADMALAPTDDTPAAMSVEMRMIVPDALSVGLEIRRLPEAAEHRWTFDLGFDQPIRIAYRRPGDYEVWRRYERFARDLAARLGFEDASRE